MEIKAIGCEPLSLKRVFIKDGYTLKVYQDTGGYASLKKALGMSQDEIIQQVAGAGRNPCAYLLREVLFHILRQRDCHGVKLPIEGSGRKFGIPPGSLLRL